MIRALALDTSTRWGSLALVERSEPSSPVVVVELGVRVEATHADHILRRVDSLLAEAEWSRQQLDAFVATRGPGSFTGLRVGLGIVRGLALASGRPCVGVLTLDAVAEAHGPAECSRLTLLEAGRGELYAADYDDLSSPPVAERPPVLVARADLAGACGDRPRVVVPAPGTVLDRHELPERARLARPPRGVAAAAARIALLTGIAADDGPERLAPVYVRQPDALLKRRQS